MRCRRGRVVLGPLAVAARRLFAAAQINSLHRFNTARLAELQGLTLAWTAVRSSAASNFMAAVWGCGN